MRVLHVNEFGNYVGGVEGYIADVSSAFDDVGHQSQCVCFTSEPSRDAVADTVFIDATSRKGTITGIERVIAAFRPDVAYIHAIYKPVVIRYLSEHLPTVAYIHSHYLMCPGYALFLRRSSRVCPFAASLRCLVNAQVEHCCFGLNPKRHIDRLWQVRRLLNVTSEVKVLVGSAFMRQRLISNGLPPEGISVLAPVLFSESVAEYTPPPDPGSILFVGRIIYEKGLRNLIQALVGLQGDWRLVVVGDGPDLHACEQLAAQLQIAERVEFRGWLAPDAVQAIYQRSAVVAMPSLWPEPYGRVGPEAFLHGRPVVGYAVGGIPDWLEDGETGYLAAPGAIDSLRECLARLLEDSGQQERMGQKAIEQAMVRWSVEAHVMKLMTYFESAIRTF